MAICFVARSIACATYPLDTPPRSLPHASHLIHLKNEADGRLDETVAPYEKRSSNEADRRFSE
jgi:hypothetical protein